ncbi:hypothetical protein [Accumulibacter sp.]|uniref:ISAzo13-like element transposase-related protein n=1 Tax=Accumulibacter sp. TaxID=2053492 RepID=UPI002583C494|nr:hypothetical protein [Accumulibacter sp.]
MAGARSFSNAWSSSPITSASPSASSTIPPYHSKYNPGERCWGILERHWNGAKLTDTQTMLEWAKSMTWKGVHPVVQLSRTAYEKGVTVAKDAMQAVASRLERNPLLAKWDILIRPAQTV